MLKSFGAEVKRRREELGLSRAEVAEAAKLTPNYIGQIERGAQEPKLLTVLALAKALDVHPGTFFKDPKHPDLSNVALDGARMIEPLGPHDQAVVLDLLRIVGRRRKALHGPAPTPQAAAAAKPAE